MNGYNDRVVQSMTSMQESAATKRGPGVDKIKNHHSPLAHGIL
jgi:hypothetical protein